MNTNTLTEALRALTPDSITWKLAFYSTTKGRDGLELEWHLCNMRGIASLASKTVEALLKKPVAEKPVNAYSPFLSYKENIGALEQTNDLVKEQMSNILFNIKNGQAFPPEDFASGEIPKTVGYAFYGEQQNADDGSVSPILFMRRTNPFQSGATATLCIGEGDEIKNCEKPILKFTNTVDLILIDGICYFFSSAVEKDLSMEDRHFAIAMKKMERVAEAAIVSNYDKLEEIAMKGKNARKFVDFENNILAHIAKLPIVEREEFLSTYGVTIDHNGHIDSSDPEQCELIIDLFCCRSCLDPLGRLSVGSNITPRE